MTPNEEIVTFIFIVVVVLGAIGVLCGLVLQAQQEDKEIDEYRKSFKRKEGDTK